MRVRVACRLVLALTGATAGPALPAVSSASPAVGPGSTASPAVARPLTGFLSQPTEQLAVPGDFAAGEITPEGDLYTGWAEYEPLVGARLTAFAQPTRVAPDPSQPLYQAQRRHGEVRYVERMFAVGVAGRPVAELTLTAVNLSERRQSARVGMTVADTRGRPVPTFFPGASASPYRFPRAIGAAGDGRLIFDPGVAFDPSWVYGVRGRDLTRDGLLLMRGPATEQAAPLPAGTPIAETAPAARFTVPLTGLPGHGTQSWTWQVPLQPPSDGTAVDAALDAATPAVAYAQFARGWRRAQAGEMAVSVPETRVDDVFRESLVDILAARDRIPGTAQWFQAVNKFQYQGFWLRDSSIMTVALDEAGLHSAAGQNLSSLPDWQLADGEYLSQSGQDDGTGQVLWETAEHALLAHDRTAATDAIAPVSRAVAWISQASETQADGLLPAETVGDDEFLTDAQVTGDDIWTAVGLRCAVSLARLADRPGLVDAWSALDRRFETHLDAGLAADQRAFGHVTPAIGTPGGDDWGNYGLGYPIPVANPHGTEVAAIIAWEREHSSQGLADFAHPGELHGYLGYPIFETELRRGGGAVGEAIDGLYAETVHTTASGEGWEDGPLAFRTRASTDNLAPHGTFAAQYVSLVHNLLVDDTGTDVDLLAGASPAWMAPGDHISVTAAATADGPVSLRLVASASGATLTWSLHPFMRDLGEPLWWSLPYWVRSATGPGGAVIRGALRLGGDHGTVTLSWRSRRPAQSLARAVTDLDRSYAARGLPAPLVPAADW